MAQTEDLQELQKKIKEAIEDYDLKHKDGPTVIIIAYTELNDYGWLDTFIKSTNHDFDKLIEFIKKNF